MSVLKVKINGQWVSIPSIKGERGERGLPGQDADPTALIDDTSGFGDLDKVVSSNELMTRLLQKASVIFANESGNPIILDDAIPDQPIRNMKVSFIPKQSGSGDPSPTNIRPILGMTGINTFHPFSKNLLDVNESKRISLNSSYSNWTSSNGIVTITGNSTGGYIMPCLPETNYVYSFDTTYRGDNLVIRVYEFSQYPTSLSDGTLIYASNSNVNKPPAPFTTTANGRWLVVGFYAHHSENITIQNMQVEFGTTATEFEPYAGSFFPIVFPALGKNLFDGRYVTGYLNSNTFITSGTSAKSAVIPCEPNTTYTIKKYESSNRFQIATSPIYPNEGGCSGYVFPGDSQMEYTYTTGEDAHYLIVYVSSSSEQATPQMMVNAGSTAEPYEPYTNTVYGGELDLLTGVLTVTHKFIDLTNVNLLWVKSTSYSGGFYCNIYNNRLGIKEQTDFICSHAKTAHILSEYEYGTCYCDGSVNIRIMESGSEVADWRTYLAEQSQNGTPVCICAEIAIPFTIQFDPATFTMYDGDNVFFTDADGIAMDYAVNTKKYVDKGSSDVKDVRVNGISVLSNGIANIPRVSSLVPGVVLVDGDGLDYVPATGKIRTAPATDAQIKAANANYKPLVPAKQDMAVFYGLSKLAGVDLASETVTLGQFPNNAKKAIANMLGIGQIYSPMERIADYAIAQDTDEVNVTTDIYGNPFKLAIAQVILMFGTEAASINDYISAAMFDQDGTKRGFATLRLINGSKNWMVHNFMTFGGIGIALGKASSSGNAQTPQLATFNYSDSQDGACVHNITALTGVQFKKYGQATTPIIAGSRVIIYGCRVIE